ncbi:nitrilase-related carbon-nitrogen hydrolase [Chloroflexota bacterium]
MSNRYSAVCVQTNRYLVTHKSEIRKANLERALELIDYAVLRLGFFEYAPTKLVVFPEVFLQGWEKDAAPHRDLWEKYAKDLAILVPGKETDMLAEKAKQYKTYIAGTVHEVMPDFSEDIAFNCGFIIDPNGEIIYKRHKAHVYMRKHSRDEVSPHDVYDRYLEFMDGKYGRKKGDILSCFFPVIETDIGKLGYIICNEGFYIESFRAMGMQGCEVLIRSSGVLEPEGSPPQQSWEIGNRAAAHFNLSYVVACAPGDLYSKGWPINTFPGHSMIVDFHGALLCHADFQGETATQAVIDIEALRKRRTDAKHNWIPQLRTETFAEMYREPIYPKNLFIKGRPATFEERFAEIPIKRFLDERIFIPPSE